jgi:hypothetical protein
VAMTIYNIIPMPPWQNPTSPEEADEIIAAAKSQLSTMPAEEQFAACKQLAMFAGCFNHHWSRAHRQQLIALLTSIGDAAIEPVLEALTNCPRSEQYDVTIDFIRKLVTNAKEQ